LQGEYTRALVRASAGRDPDFDGFYVYGSYFLTGEHRAYTPRSGAFGRVKPKRDFDGKGGLGAWEVGVRYSHLDLDDAELRGGKMSALTAGLNWYMNPNTRVMLNYVFADLERVGETNIFQTRLQVDF
jgi:phosphate-selective porin OprO/OprP